MKKILKIFFLVLFVLLLLGTFVFLWSKSRVKEVQYETVKPTVRTLEKKTIITGTIEPRNEISLKPQISGIIVELYKEAGQIVKAGDVIAKVKVVPDIAQLNSAESRVKTAEINLEQSQNNFDRVEKLYKSGVNSKELFEQAQTSLRTSKEELANAQESLQIIKEGISKSTAQYSNTLIKSTVSGMILDVPVKVGNSVIQANNFNDGTTIATIANMNDLIFNGKIDETEVGKVHVGNHVKLIIGAMQDAHFEAILEYISPKGTLENGATLFQIKAAVNKSNESAFIRSGYSANGEIITQRVENVLTIPENTISFSADSAFVFIENSAKDASEKFIKKFVKIGLSDGFFIEVTDGLDTMAVVRGNPILDLPKIQVR